VEERRQGKRVIGTIQSVLSLRENLDGPSLITPIPCLIDNVSSQGLGLSLPQVRLGLYHLFYSPQDNPTIFLCLELIPAEEPPLMLLIEPVWFNRELSEPAMPFQMGVRLRAPASDKVIKQVKRLVSQSNSASGS